jgi:ribosomal protein S18 acetylase RimI-like enzyme
MNSADSFSGDDLRIEPVSTPNWREVLELVFGRLSTGDRQKHIEMGLAAAKLDGASRQDGASRPDGLLGAYRQQRLVGAVHWQSQPGRIATIWPPWTVEREPTATAESLLESACNRLAGQDICMVQALLRTDTSNEAAVLQKGGFNRLAKLYYLVSPEVEFPRHPPLGPLEYEPLTPASFDRLAAMVEATYCETLDCPAMSGIRQIDDVLAGYCHSGGFDPQRWLIVRHDSQDVGCLLLNDHPKEGNYELVYMGIAKSARGQGWGLQVVRQAQWQTRCADRPRLVLAVDTANHPALTIYTTAGFRAWDRRSAYVKILQ